MRNIVIHSLAAAIALGSSTASSSSSSSFRSISSSWVSATPSFVLSMPRGGASSAGGRGSEYEAMLEYAKNRAIEMANVKIEEARRKIVDECSPVSNFGAKADEICSSAIEGFARAVAEAETDADGSSSSSSSSSSAAYARKLRELEMALDAPLQVLYLRQLALHRDSALSSYRSASRTTDGSDYESMLAADAKFVRDAESSTRKSSSSSLNNWSYDAERAALQSVMSDVASVSRKLVDVQVKSSSQQSTAMQFLQQQQQMIQQLQQQLYGQSSPWNVGVAYRIPDTNFNLQGSYQQGRANIQLSCVPDEYAPMLGPNGFTNGVGPGNLGLSLSLSI